MTLHSINLIRIPAAPLVDFGAEVKGLVTELGATVSYIQPAYGEFVLWHEKGIALLEYSRKSQLTKEIQKQDVKTEHDYADVLALVLLARHSGVAEKVAAANELSDALKPFKGITNKDRQARIGDLIAIVGLFAGRYSPNITAIGAEAQRATLASDLQTLEALVQTRGHEELVKPTYTFADVKKGENESFAFLRTIINGLIGTSITNPTVKQQLTDLATILNSRIDYYIQVYEPSKHAIDLHSPRTSIEILTPLPLQIAAGTQGLVQIKVRYSTGTSAGTVELREGYDYIKRYENNIAPNPNAKVIAHGIGKYKGEQDATFEIRIVI